MSFKTWWMGVACVVGLTAVGCDGDEPGAAPDAGPDGVMEEGTAAPTGLWTRVDTPERISTDYARDVALLGDLLAVGDKGRVHLLRRQPDGRWAHEDTVRGDFAQSSYDDFGMQVALGEGGWLYVASPWGFGDGVQTGVVFAFRQVDGAWTQVARWDERKNGAEAGRRLAADGDRVIVGRGRGAGAVVLRVTDAGFEPVGDPLVGADDWRQGAGAYAHLAGDWAVIGAAPFKEDPNDPREDTPDAGGWLYQWDGSAWQQRLELDGLSRQGNPGLVTTDGVRWAFTQSRGAQVRTLAEPDVPVEAGRMSAGSWISGGIELVGGYVVTGDPGEAVEGARRVGALHFADAETGAFLGTVPCPVTHEGANCGRSLHAAGDVLVVGVKDDDPDEDLDDGAVYLLDTTQLTFE